MAALFQKYSAHTITSDNRLETSDGPYQFQVMHGGKNIYEIKPIHYQAMNQYERVYVEIKGNTIKMVGLKRHMHSFKSLVQTIKNNDWYPVPEELLRGSNQMQ